MHITHWLRVLKELRRSPRRRIGRTHARLGTEALESRVLLSATASFELATGTVSVEWTGEIVVDCNDAGELTVNGETVALDEGTVQAADVLSIRIRGSRDSETIDLSNVTIEKFSSLSDNAVNVRSGAGDDTIIGSEFGDRMFGGLGNDMLEGLAGPDRLRGQAGNDTLVGGWENDRLFGGLGLDELDGSEGNDMLRGQGGADTLMTGNGTDRMLGLQEIDTVIEATDAPTDEPVGEEPEAGPGEEPEADPGEEPEADPGEEPEADPGEEPEADPGEEPEADPGAEPEADPGEESEADPGDEPEADPGEEPEADPGEEPEADPGEEPEADPGEEPEADPGEEPEPDLGEEPDTVEGGV